MPTQTDHLKTVLSTVGGAAYEAQMARAAGGIAGVGTSADIATMKLERSAAAAGKASAALLAVGVAGVYALGSVVKVASDFQSSMSEIRAMSGATAEEMEKLEAATRSVELRAIGVGALEAAKGLWSLSSAGFSVEEQIAALIPTAQAAKAMGADFAAVSALGVSIMGQYGLQASDFDRIMTGLVGTYQTSQASFSRLQAAFRQGGAIAAQVGWEFEQAAGTFALFFDAGKEGEQAGTILRGALAKLLNPSKDAKMALDEMGISAMDVSRAMQDPVELVALFEGANMSAAQSVRLFGTESMAFTDIVKAGSGALEEAIEKARNHADIQKVALEQTDNLEGAVARLNAEWEAAATTSGASFTKQLGQMVDQVTALLQGFNDLSPAQQQQVFMWAKILTGVALVGAGYFKVLQLQHQLALATARRAATAAGANAAEAGSANLLAVAYGRVRLAILSAGAARIALLGGAALAGGGAGYFGGSAAGRTRSTAGQAAYGAGSVLAGAAAGGMIAGAPGMIAGAGAALVGGLYTMHRGTQAEVAQRRGVTESVAEHQARLAKMTPAQRRALTGRAPATAGAPGGGSNDPFAALSSVNFGPGTGLFGPTSTGQTGAAGGARYLGPTAAGSGIPRAIPSGASGTGAAERMARAETQLARVRTTSARAGERLAAQRKRDAAANERELDRVRHANAQAYGDHADRAMRANDVVQKVIGGQMGSEAAEAIQRITGQGMARGRYNLSGVRTDGSNTITLEIKAPSDMPEAQKAQMAAWLRDLIREGGKQGVPLQ